MCDVVSEREELFDGLRADINWNETIRDRGGGWTCRPYLRPHAHASGLRINLLEMEEIINT